jgi:tol-pal system protein YbgF
MLRLRTATAAAVLILGLGGTVALAQSAQPVQEPPIRRLDRLDRAVRELNAIVRQGAATGRPVIVAPETLPGEFDQLRTRLDDLEAAQRSQTSTIESLTADLNTARRTAEQAQAQARDLQARVAALEEAAKAAAAAAAAAPPPETAAPEETAPPAAASAAEAFKRARQQLLEGHYAGAGTAFQAYVDQFPTDARAPEARYWLGETLYIREDYTAAAQAYAGALKGWPKASWAPDATVKLANALTAIQRTTAACQALTELDRRYADASAAVKARAKTARGRAKCAAPAAA